MAVPYVDIESVTRNNDHFAVQVTGQHRTRTLSFKAQSKRDALGWKEAIEAVKAATDRGEAITPAVLPEPNSTPLFVQVTAAVGLRCKSSSCVLKAIEEIRGSRPSCRAEWTTDIVKHRENGLALYMKTHTCNDVNIPMTQLKITILQDHGRGPGKKVAQLHFDIPDNGFYGWINVPVCGSKSGNTVRLHLVISEIESHDLTASADSILPEKAARIPRALSPTKTRSGLLPALTMAAEQGQQGNESLRDLIHIVSELHDTSLDFCRVATVLKRHLDLIAELVELEHEDIHAVRQGLVACIDTVLNFNEALVPLQPETLQTDVEAILAAHMKKMHVLQELLSRRATFLELVTRLRGTSDTLETLFSNFDRRPDTRGATLLSAMARPMKLLVSYKDLIARLRCKHFPASEAVEDVEKLLGELLSSADEAEPTEAELILFRHPRQAQWLAALGAECKAVVQCSVSAKATADYPDEVIVAVTDRGFAIFTVDDSARVFYPVAILSRVCKDTFGRVVAICRDVRVKFAAFDRPHQAQVLLEELQNLLDETSQIL